MCKDYRTIYSCGHDKVEEDLYKTCDIFQFTDRSRKAMGKNRRVPNHETETIFTKVPYVCETCIRTGSRSPNPVYLRETISTQGPALTHAQIQNPMSGGNQQPPPLAPRPPPRTQNGGAPPRTQSSRSTGLEKKIANAAEGKASSTAPQQKTIQSGQTELPPLKNSPLFRYLNTIGMSAVRGPYGLVHVKNPAGLEPLDNFLMTHPELYNLGFQVRPSNALGTTMSPYGWGVQYRSPWW